MSNRSYVLYAATMALVMTVFMLVFRSGAAQATMLYSIDVDNDRLVKVNSQTGAVVTVGGLGIDVAGAELAITQGRLFMLEGLMSPVLHEIDRSTGQVISSTGVTTPGSFTLAEGLVGLLESE